MMNDNHVLVPERLDAAAIVAVDGGRGFLVHQAPWPHRVITAAHCLANLPPPHPGSYTHERTYRHLVGPLGMAPMLSAECVFVDPVADVAVLECPDEQTLCDEADAYEQFMALRPALRIGTITASTPAWLLTLAGHWERCTVRPGTDGRSLTLVDATDGNAPGTSGSPILLESGRAVGVISVGTEVNSTIQYEQSGQPWLTKNLPAWLLHRRQLPILSRA